MEARALVADYIKENNRIPELRIATDANYINLCEFLQSELEKIGIRFQIDIMPTASLREAKSNGNLELFRASWIADYPDAENYLSLFYSKNFSPSGPNYTHYANSKFDQLFTLAIKTKNDSLRTLYYRQMDSLALSEYPIVPLYYDEVVRFTQKNIRGLEMNPVNLLELKRVQKR